MKSMPAMMERILAHFPHDYQIFVVNFQFAGEIESSQKGGQRGGEKNLKDEPIEYQLDNGTNLGGSRALDLSLLT
jgi:hypothetical protein